jgi:hypothetical protein
MNAPRIKTLAAAGIGAAITLATFASTAAASFTQAYQG